MSTVIGARIGNGSFGIVFEGLYKNQPCAFKVSKPNDAHSTDEILNEDSKLRYLCADPNSSCPHIIERIGILKYKNQPALVLSLMGRNLEQYYKSNPNGLFLDETRKITKQLVEALCFLFKKEVMHCDLKPQNILMSPDEKSVILADFGSSSFFGPIYNPPGQLLQTRFYRSPEVVLGITPTSAIDVWSLAAVIAEIYCKKIIFDAVDDSLLPVYHRLRLEHIYPNDMYVQGINTVYYPTVFNSFRSLSQIIDQASSQKKEDGELLKKLVYKMFMYRPEIRPTPLEISEDPFLVQEDVICEECQKEETNVAAIEPNIENDIGDKRLQKTYRSWDDEF